MAKKKVIIVGPGPDFIGGISEFITGLRNSLLKYEFELVLFDALAVKQRGKIVDKTKLSIIEINRTMRVFGQFIKCLIQNPEAAVHIHSSCYLGFYEKLVMLIIASIYNRDTYFHIHGGEFISFYTDNNFKWILRLLLSLSTKIISVSPDIKNILNLDHKTTVIGNGITLPDINLSDPPDLPKMTFLSVSVLEHRKRIDLILEAVKILKELGYDNFQFVFAGNGPVKKDLLKYIEDNSLEDVAIYKGVVRGDQKDSLFRNANVFISTSLAESFGISIAEGMSYGLGIISTYEGIASYCFKDNNGIVIEKNNLDSLKEAMLSYIKNEQDLKHQRNFNYKYINDNYSWNYIAIKIRDVYLNI